MNHTQQYKDNIILGSRLWCTRQKRDAEDYYLEKLEEIEAKWQKLQQQATSENIGVAFVSFKDKECVSETIDEFDLVKTKLVSHPRYKDLEIEHWEVEQA